MFPHFLSAILSLGVTGTERDWVRKRERRSLHKTTTVTDVRGIHSTDFGFAVALFFLLTTCCTHLLCRASQSGGREYTDTAVTRNVDTGAGVAHAHFMQTL